MSVVSFALAVVFIIRLFSTSAFRVPKLIGGHFGSEAKVLLSYALKMITVVIETFARCQLYRLLWP